MTTTTEYERWSQPWTGDPFSDADGAARASQTRRAASEVLTAAVGTRFGPMAKVAGGWSAEAAAAADAVAEPGSAAWRQALGSHERAVLTADGRSANREQWCEQPDGCGGSAEWVRYEGWIAAGCEAHGFVCGSCRRLVQTG